MSQPAFLYVEDDEMSRIVMNVVMTRMLGFENLTIFEDSADFLERLLSLDPMPDFIFLDIQMKPYTGFEMLEMIRETEEYAEIPVIALTASVMNEEVELLRRAGFNSVIAKPLDQQSFPHILEDIMNGKEIWKVL
ncbi:MAG: response regulator [Chloroflexi bacterium]|nr:response regulator [Chloroflexota bacterium]